MTVRNLPGLKAKHGVPPLKESGKWLSTNVDLDVIARALPVEIEDMASPRREPIQAIPDPWAQASAFGIALRDKNHSLHKQTLSRWRGLLAIMALRGRHRTDFTLRPQPVDLSDDSHFARVMTTLTPEIALRGAGPLWKQPTLIMLRAAGDHAGVHETPLAMTNPICLISPGRDTHKEIVPKIGWAQGDLKCPLTKGSPKLSVPDLSILARWLDELAAPILQMAGEVAMDIGSLLREFAAEVRAEVGGQLDPTQPPENMEQKEPGLFRPLWNNVALEEHEVAPTEALLKLRAFSGVEGSDGGRIKGYILADPAIADALHKDPAHIHVWKRQSLADLLGSDNKFREARSAALAEGYLLLKIDDLMTQRAARLTKRPLVSAHPQGLQDMILPLRPLALLFAKNLKDRVSGQVQGDRASIALSLTLVADSGAETTVRLKRDYASAPAPGEGELVKAEDWDIYNCQLWPDFRSDAWHSYLARFYYRGALQEKMTRPVQAVSATLLNDLINRSSDAANAEIALSACNNGSLLPNRTPSGESPLFKQAGRSTARNNAFREEVQFSNAPFDAIYYVEQLGDERSRAPVGMVLIDVPTVELPANSTKVAIDFGSTNTVGAFGDGKDPPPVKFRNRMVFPVKPADQIVQEQVIHASRNQFSGFLPPEERRTPLPSVAIPKLPYDQKETLWTFRNLIYFHPSQAPSEGEEERELADFMEATRSARFDLKWSQQQVERDAASDFLTQFMVMTAAELLTKGYNPAESRWLFSVPEAMSPTKRRQFERNIVHSLRFVGVATDSDEWPLKSEGLSAASYMLRTGGFVTDSLNIILDIGGSTTDMTIWNHNTPVWKGSIKLAGGNFFTQLLVNNPEILKGIGLDSWAKSINAATEDSNPAADGGKRKQLAEMLFSARDEDSGGPDLQSAMTNHWSRLTADLGDPLRFAAVTYIAGIAWYVGRVVRHFLANNPSLLDEDGAREPAFAVCGRGGGIFKMLHGTTRADRRTDVTRALDVFLHATGLEGGQPARFSASSAPKLEVVRGMIDEDGKIDISADGMEGLGTVQPLGLAIDTPKGRVEADALLDSFLIDDGAGKVDMAEFYAFLEALEKCTGLAINVLPDQREGAARRIAAKVSERLDEIRRDRAAAPRNRQDSVAVEAPFLIALRALIDLMALPASEREDLMEIYGEE